MNANNLGLRSRTKKEVSKKENRTKPLGSYISPGWISGAGSIFLTNSFYYYFYLLFILNIYIGVREARARGYEVLRRPRGPGRQKRTRGRHPIGFS